MAVNRFKVSLNSARFPLVSTKAPRAVFIPGLDSAPRTPRVFMGADESVDYGLAQLLYGENIMPVSEGLRSVGYSQLIAPTVVEDFDQVFALRDEDENTVLYSPAKGKNYVYDSVAGQWESKTFLEIHGVEISASSPDTEETAKVTYAYVDGRTFVCYSELLATGDTDASLLYWNPVTQTLEPAGALVTNLPFDAGTIRGISASNGYLLVYSGLTVAWAPFDGTAFDYSIYLSGSFTGAGYQIPEDVQGPITAAINLPGGFVMFTTKNAIAASYHSQNLSAPWVFREIAGAGGLESYEQATVEGSMGTIMAYTTTGIQKISLNSAEEMHPDVSDFIAGRQIERYSFESHELRQSGIPLDFYVKLSAIANRYVAISYGTFPGVFSYALLYDMTLKRWGKLRIVHRDCFYYSYGAQTAGLTYSMLGDVPYDNPLLGTYAEAAGQSSAIVAAQHGLAFLAQDGSVSLANWSNEGRDSEDVAVAVIGRIQLTRSGSTQVNRVELEGLTSGSVYLAPSYSGRALATPVELATILDEGDFRIVGDLIDCKNFNLIVEGTFNLSTVIVEAATSGKV